jgi:hypothetical protein
MSTVDNSLHVMYIKLVKGKNLKPQTPDLLSAIRKNLDSGHYWHTAHAVSRALERGIPLPEILFALRRGKRREDLDRFDREFDAWNYVIEGRNPNGDELRVVVSFDSSGRLLIVTVIELSKNRG